MKQQSISFLAALFININIILGTGLFINSGILAHKAGLYGAFSYLLVGIIVLPIVLAISLLLRKYPDNGFYGFGNQSMGPIYGFVTGWIYFFAKQNSAVVAIYVFSSMIQEILFTRAAISNWLVTCCFIALFSYCNIHNMKTGLLFQHCLMLGKGIITVTIILSGLSFSGILNFNPTHVEIGSYLSTIPFILFSLLGFESICSVSMHAQNSKNLWKTIIGSYITVIIIYCIYQTIVFGFVNTGSVNNLLSFQETFALIAQKISTQIGMPQYILSKLFYLCIALSALSGGYGILYANQWNLYALAEAKSFFGHQLFVQKNSAHMPVYASLAQLVTCTAYLLISGGQLFILQQASAFGCTCTYGLSCLFLVYCSQNYFETIMGILGTISASLLLISCIKNFLTEGFFSLIVFTGIVLLGILLFYCEKKYEKTQKCC